MRTILKKYETGCEDISEKYKKATKERQKNSEDAVKSLQIETKNKAKDEEKSTKLAQVDVDEEICLSIPPCPLVFDEDDTFVV